MTVDKLKTAVANINAYLSECHDDDDTVTLTTNVIRSVKENYEELIEAKAEIEMLQEFLDDKCDRCIAKERTEAVKEFANELFRVFAGHCDYHGDTILAKIVCLAEGKVIKTAEPIDTNNIKAEAVKEFAERLKKEIKDTRFAYEAEQECECIDSLVKEMVGEG